MQTVKHLLNTKGSQVWSVAPQSSVYEALRLMNEKNVGAVLVMDANQVIGIFSERDYARKVILQDKISKELPVQDVMSSPVVSVHPQQSIEECMLIMSKHHIRHLAVIDHDKLVGLLSIRDVMQSIITEQQNMIQRLEGYMLNGESELLV